MGILDSITGRRSAAEEQQRMLQKQHDQALQRDLASQAAAFDKEGRLSREYLETMVEHGLDESTALLLRNMLSKDFVLANLTHAQVHEKIWLTRVEMLKVRGQHPLEESVYQGEYRQFAFDDERQGLEPLEPEQESLLAQALLDIEARLTRGEDMAQQDAFSTVISETRSLDDGGRGDSSEGWFFK